MKLLSVILLVLSFVVFTSTANAAKENFDRSKPHAAAGVDDDCDGTEAECKKARKAKKKDRKSKMKADKKEAKAKMKADKKARKAEKKAAKKARKAEKKKMKKMKKKDKDSDSDDGGNKAQDYNSSRSNRRGAMAEDDAVMACKKLTNKKERKACMKKAKGK